MEKSSTDTGDLTWGYLEDTEVYGRKSSSSDYIIANKENIRSEHQVNIEASHCLIYALSNEKVFGIYDARAIILMQMRFDGYLGFPGGLIDEGETAVESLNRELVEEMNIDTEKYCVKEDDYIVSHYHTKTKIGLHFYALRLSAKEIHQIELRALSAKDYGQEVLGLVRVPLYTLGDGYRGFPAFLENNFVGYSKEHLLHAIKKLKIMSDAEIERSMKRQNC